MLHDKESSLLFHFNLYSDFLFVGFNVIGFFIVNISKMLAPSKETYVLKH